MKKILLIAMSLMMAAPAAFARLSDGQSASLYLSSCGGTIEAKISGQQLNLIFRDVKYCSRIEVNGQTIAPLEGTNAGRTGSRTVTLDKLNDGSNTISIHSESNAHRDDMYLDIQKTPDCTYAAQRAAAEAAGVFSATASFNRVSNKGNLVYDAYAYYTHYEVTLDTNCQKINVERK